MTTHPQRFADAVAPLPSDLLTPDQVAVALGLSQRTLAAWRSARRGGPAYVKCGSRVRYRKQAVAAWLEAHTHSSAEA
jgi:excisionase family DNA binding protein